jgi:hypothetical protein
MICANCGNANNEGARFCRNCGQPIQATATQPSYQQNPPPPQVAYPGYAKPASALQFALPGNIKLFLPLIGMGIAILGMLLPWFAGDGASVSGFGLMGVLSIQGSYGDIPGEINLLKAAFWIAFVCAIAGHVMLWKHAATRIVVTVVSALGLAAMIAITIVLFGEFGQDMFSGVQVGAGFIITWLGFGVMAAGAALMWFGTSARSAPAPYYPPPQQ